MTQQSLRENINTKEYWDSQHDFEHRRVRKRKAAGRAYMESIIPFLGIPRDFTGSLLDFGCGMGFGVEVLIKAFPKAQSLAAIFRRKPWPTPII